MFLFTGQRISKRIRDDLVNSSNIVKIDYVIVLFFMLDYECFFIENKFLLLILENFFYSFDIRTNCQNTFDICQPHITYKQCPNLMKLISSGTDRITKARLLFNMNTLLTAIKQEEVYASVSLPHIYRYSYERQTLPTI